MKKRVAIDQRHKIILINELALVVVASECIIVSHHLLHPLFLRINSEPSTAYNENGSGPWNVSHNRPDLWRDSVLYEFKGLPLRWTSSSWWCLHFVSAIQSLHESEPSKISIFASENVEVIANEAVGMGKSGFDHRRAISPLVRCHVVNLHRIQNFHPVRFVPASENHHFLFDISEGRGQSLARRHTLLVFNGVSASLETDDLEKSAFKLIQHIERICAELYAWVLFETKVLRDLWFCHLFRSANYFLVVIKAFCFKLE